MGCIDVSKTNSEKLNNLFCTYVKLFLRMIFRLVRGRIFYYISLVKASSAIVDDSSKVCFTQFQPTGIITKYFQPYTTAINVAYARQLNYQLM